jgi:hypothetical protein
VTLTSITTVAGLALSCVAAFALGGRSGTGALSGYLAGAFFAGLALVAQRAISRTRPELLVASVMASFLVKAFAMLATTLAVRYVPALAERVDAVAFLFGFAGAALLILGPATFETLRALGSRRTTSVANVREIRSS